MTLVRNAFILIGVLAGVTQAQLAEYAAMLPACGVSG